MADPESCWATSLRRASLTSSHAPNFLYWNLHQQCDEALLLGGMGVETCAHPTYRPITSHKWQHKALLPQSFPHGTKLGLSCWQERYSGVKGSGSASSIALFCVNGDWFNADNEEELGSFSCEACVQVADVGFKQIEARNEQEIWYMNRMRLSLATEVVDNTQTGMHCLKFGSGSTELKMMQQTKCGSTIMAEFHGVTDSSSRLVKLVEGSNQCLQEAMLGDLPIGIHSTCSSGATAQQIPMEDLPGMLWRIHTKDHEQAGHRLSPSLIDCWGRGAIGKVEMMHLFNTNRAQTAAYVGRVRVPGLIVAQGNNQWHRLSANTGFGWRKSDYPDATETRMCLTYSDHATSSDGNLKVRLRRVDGAGGTVYFTDSFAITWSGTGLFHHVCGPWHAISTISCGYGWTDTCQVDWLHSTWMSIKTVELEFGSSNPNHARFFRGRMDLPVTYDGTPAANTWTSIGNWFYLATNQYDGNFVRICVVFTDSSTSGTFSVRLRKADGTIFFTDNLGNTWSGSGLMHAECGSWHSSSGISCGSSWGNTCQLQMLHTQNVHTKVYEADLEFKSDSTSTPTAYLGRMKLDAYASTTATSNWFRISPNGLFINTDDYPTATEIRPCIVFSDSSSGQGTVKVRLRRTDAAGGTIFYEDDFGGTYSGSGLYHVTCGAWRSVASISCGTSWVNTCQLDAMHGQAVSTTISSYFMEFRVALARDVCRFAPVITRMAGNTAELFKIGSWSDWQYRLSDAPIYCPEGKILTDLDASTEHMRYSCGSVAGLGSCSEGFTAQADVKDWSTYANLGTLSIVCPQDALLNGFHFEFSEGGRWIRFRYTCCHAAGAPMALIPVQPGPASSIEGLYCPVGKDASGRPMYDQTFESPTVLTSSMVSLTAWACDCCQCANDKTTIDVGRYGTVAAGNSFGVTGWCGKCVLYCDGVKADEYALWGSSDSGRAFPSQCTGAISVEIHGGGHCGGCEVKGSGLMINPWPKQPSLLDTGSESHTAPQRLSFDPNAGKWCLAGTCTEVDGRVQPIGLSSQSFDIAAVSDFDGVFQGKGVPKQGGGNAAALKARLRAIKTPKRPKAPKVPKLETFTPEEPTFAAECMDYNRLWASIQESYKDADGTVTPHTNQLKAEPVYDLSETNPCEVAAAVSGTRGKIGGGDGRSTPEKMPYTELDGCAARVITRDLELAKRERDSEIFHTIFDIADESMDLVCDAPPNIETAPMGVGAEFQAEDWCTDGFNLAHAMVLMASYHGGIGFANSIYEVENEDNQDCDPLQAGLDRLFCDIHCVRDAVVRGDRAILRNLKAATEVTNNNMKKMVEWSVAANRAETGWLAAKLDTTEDRLSIRIQMVQDALATSNTAALQEAKEVSGSMLEELAGFADAASLNAVSRHTANEALEEYLRSAELSGGPNISRASAALQQLEMLHAKMSSAGSASRMHTLGQQFQREAANLQVLAKKQLQILGVYKERGNLTSHAVRTWQEETHAIERRNALVQVDRIWWELRSTLDNYLEVAELQVKAFLDSLTAIESYEHCSANLGQVQKSYAQNLKARDSGHFVLRETWRDSVNLIGELASVIVDGEIFQIFVDTEGCHSALVTQTMKQVRFAVRSLSLLSHRFEVGGLPKPDGTSLLQSLRRIRKSFKAAKAGCDNGKDVAGK